MRIIVPDRERLKQAAKFLVRESSHLNLSAMHEMLAISLGYRDWHDLSGVTKSGPPSPQKDIQIADLLRVVTEIASSSGVRALDVQYALSRAQILWGPHSPSGQQLQLCSAIWRETLFGAPGRGKAGTVVKDKAYGANEPAYLIRAGRPTYVLFDTGLGTRADFEVTTPRRPLPDFVPSRLWLPYGYWTLGDGSEVIFSRDYFPLWRVTPGMVERLDPWLWIRDVVDEFHFAASISATVWATGAARDQALRHLELKRIFELPKLLNVMAYLFSKDVSTIGEAVRVLRDIDSEGRPVPPYAEINGRLQTYR